MLTLNLNNPRQAPNLHAGLAGKAANLAKFHRLGLRHEQSGLALIIALIVLVAMTIGAIAMVRSVDTNNLIAGNLAFQQSAMQEGSKGIEDAIAWIEEQKNTCDTTTSCPLNLDNSSRGYNAAGAATFHSPESGESWEHFWTSIAAKYTLATNDNTKNTAAYVIDRQCTNAGATTDVNAQCRTSPLVVAAAAQGGDGQEAGKVGIQRTLSSMSYYRITVRVSGPKNTVSFIQAMVAL